MANPLYLAGYIERLGTGTSDMVDECVAMGLKAPEFIQDSNFRAILWRKNDLSSNGNALSSEKNDPTSTKNALSLSEKALSSNENALSSKENALSSTIKLNKKQKKISRNPLSHVILKTDCSIEIIKLLENISTMQ